MYDTDGSTALEAVAVNATNRTTGQRLTGNNIPLTGSNGKANVDIANISGGYDDGDTIEIFAYSPGKRASTTHTVVAAGGGGTATLTMGLAVTYCTASDVRRLLGLSGEFTETSNPSFIQVEDYIKAAEDEIDFRTAHSWRTRRSRTTTGDDTSAEYEWHDIPKEPWDWALGRRVKLDHRLVKTLDTGEGDVLELWNGTEYEDWTVTKTEGRADDYWLDYENGVLYIKSHHHPRNKAIRIKYRYGEEKVPNDVKIACAKLAAMNLLGGEDRSVLFPEGTNNIAIADKEMKWRADVERFFRNRGEITVI